MGKNGTKRAGMEEIGTREGLESARREDRLGRIFDRTRRALRELVIGYGLEVFQELLEEDRNTLCGARYALSAVAL
jgi:hypothetical protein